MANVIDNFEENNEKEIASAISRKWLSTNSTSYFNFILKIAKQGFNIKINDFTKNEKTMLLMLHYDVWQNAAGFNSLEESINAIGNNTQFVQEIIEVMEYLLDKIDFIAKQNNLLVIEDAAQSHGAELGVGSKELGVSNAKAYSFYPSKNLGCLGDGGAVITSDDELNKIIRAIRNYGSEKKYVNDFIGINSRLDELQAAFLNVKLPDLDADNQKRREIANRYLAEIKNDKIVLPFYDGSTNHVFHLFVIRTEKRAELQDYLKENGIETMIHYPIPPHKQKALFNWESLSFPITEKIHNEVLSIPLNSGLKASEIQHIITVLNKF